jgi:hypothetical protein
VALVAKSYQIVRMIMPEATSRLFVMDLKVATRSAALTTPAIPREDLYPQQFVRFSFKS